MVIDVWSRSSFRVTQCRLPASWLLMSAKQLILISPFTECNKTHFCCKFWIHSLDMKLFYWFKWYKWLKMAFKISQEYPTASLDITEDFHILHIAYVYICYSILKAKTYNWLPKTHTHTHMTRNNYKQEATGHVTSLANGHLTGSDAVKFRPLWIIKKIILLTLDWLWGRLQALLQWRNVSS